MNNHNEHQELTSALDRLAQQDRDAAPDHLIQSLSQRRTPRRSTLARIRPWLLAAAAAIAVATPLLLNKQATPALTTEPPLALDDEPDTAWLLGDDLTELDEELAQIALNLTAINPANELDLIGEEG